MQTDVRHRNTVGIVCALVLLLSSHTETLGAESEAITVSSNGAGMKSGEPSLVVRSTKETIASRAAPWFHEGSGSAVRVAQEVVITSGRMRMSQAHLATMDRSTAPSFQSLADIVHCEPGLPQDLGVDTAAHAPTLRTCGVTNVHGGRGPALRSRA